MTVTLRRIGLPLLLAASTLLAYAGVGELGFVQLDDPGYLTQNPTVQRGLTAEGLRYAFTSSVLGNWHPLTWLSHLLVVEFYGLAPAAHHWANVLLHVAGVLLLHRLLVEATGRRVPSFAVAALFALHPLHVESVAWVAERKDVLSTPLWFLATLAWVRWTRTGAPRQRWAALAFLVLGLMSKAMLVTLPFTLLLLDVWPLRRWRGVAEGGRTARELVREKRLLFAAVAAFCVVTFLVQSDVGAVGTVERYPLPARLANSVTAVLAYLEKTVWPAGLSVFYPYPRSFEPLRVGLALAVVVGVSAAAVALRRSFPPLLVGWFWFLGTLVPVVGIVQVGAQAYADRYTYVPHVGLFVAVVWAVARLVEHWPARARLAVAFAGAALTVALLVRTRQQVDVWKDDYTLFRHALDVTEDNAVAHDFFGRQLAHRGDVAGGIEHYRAAIRVQPDLAVAHLNLGVALQRTRDLEGAVASFREAIRVRPHFPTAWANLAAAYGESGRPEDAIEACRRALELDDGSASAHMNLAITLMNLGRVREAGPHYERALELQPSLAARTQAREYAWILSTSVDPAVRDGARALSIAETYNEATRYRDLRGLLTLAAAQAEAGRFPEAVHTAEQGLAAARANGQTALAERFEGVLPALRAGRPLRAAEAPGSGRGTAAPRRGGG